jgi:hypothetical protein
MTFSVTLLGTYNSANRINHFCLFVFYAPRKNFGGAYCGLCVRPSSCLLNLSSEIDVVDSKCSFRQGIVDQCLSRSYWKVQGHSEHIKKSIFNICSNNRQRYRHDIFKNIYRVLQAIYGPEVNPITPQKRKLLNISKTIEIPIPKPYIFLFLVLIFLNPILKYIVLETF